MTRHLTILFIAWTTLSPVMADEAATSTTNCVQPLPRDCASNRSCDFPLEVRECEICVFRSPFSQSCQIRANDPSCEAAKAAQTNLVQVKRAQCEADKVAERASCESANVTARLAFESCVSAAGSTHLALPETTSHSCPQRPQISEAPGRSRRLGRAGGAAAGYKAPRSEV